MDNIKEKKEQNANNTRRLCNYDYFVLICTAFNTDADKTKSFVVCNLLCVQAIRNNINKFVIELFLDTRACVHTPTYRFSLIKVNNGNFIVIGSRLRSYKLKAKDILGLLLSCKTEFNVIF